MMHFISTAGKSIFLSTHLNHEVLHGKTITRESTFVSSASWAYMALLYTLFCNALFWRKKMRKWCLIIAQIVSIFLFATANAEEVKPMMNLTSPSFESQGEIPKKFTCDGQDISPALAWSGVPERTKSLALIVDDPDAPDPKKPKMTWVHWVLYNIPAEVGSLPEGVKEKDLPKGTLQGLNDWKRTGYGGPCPPIGKHRYFHKLYALDIVLSDLKRPTKADLEKAMAGHVLSSAELVGLYQRK